MFTEKLPIAMASAFALAMLLSESAAAASFAAPAAVPTVTSKIDDAEVRSLEFDSPLSHHKVTDNGALAEDTVLERLQLVLKRSDERQAALDKLVADQLDKKSPEYHHWVASEDLATVFGPAQSDIQKTVDWLTRRGFTIDETAPDHMSIAFTGTVSQVKSTFKTDLHGVVAEDGKVHTANMSAPAIPAALAGVVRGVTLSNFFPKPTSQKVGAVQRNNKTGRYSVTKRAPQFTIPAGSDGTFYAVAPADLAKIYNFNEARRGAPFFFDQNGNSLPLTGKGVSLIVAEQSDIKTSDWQTFRKLYGLSGYTAGSLKVVHPGGCKDPGFIPDESEAALDAEWSSAAAPDAEIIFASCAQTPTTFGVMTTLQNLVSHGPKAAAISISYGGCEIANGLSFTYEWSSLVEEAAAEGYSVFVSAGDSAGAGCYTSEESPADGGLGVNALASNPYDTAAGGTDFGDASENTTSTYWSSKNGANLGSALSYIPEIPWDDSCASSVLVTYLGAKGPIDLCNQSGDPYLNIVGGGGGKSLYFAKPAWQKVGVRGMPKDGARDLPDVSLFASNGAWGHFYVFCMSDANEGGSPCSTTNLNDILGSAAGGTSFVAPILAGVQALVVQEAGGNVGNAAPVYYQLAKLQFDAPYLLSTCKSNQGASISPACVFNEITRGNNAVPCLAGTPDCYTNSASTAGIGVLSTSLSVEDPAFPTDLGYSYAVGLGSINVTNLLLNYLNP